MSVHALNSSIKYMKPQPVSIYDAVSKLLWHKSKNVVTGFIVILKPDIAKVLCH